MVLLTPLPTEMGGGLLVDTNLYVSKTLIPFVQERSISEEVERDHEQWSEK